MIRSLAIIMLCFHLGYSNAQPQRFLSLSGEKELQNHYTCRGYKLDLLSLLDNPTPEQHYLKTYSLFIAYQQTENSTYSERFKEYTSSFLKIDNEKRPIQLMKINLLIQQSLIYWSQEDFADGVRSFYKAHRLFNKLSKGGNEYRKLEALFNIFLAQIPEQHQFFASIFGLEGDAKKGFQQLFDYTQQIINHDGLYEEGMVLYGYCLLKFGEPTETEVKHFIALSHQLESPILSFVSSSLCVKTRQCDDGLFLCNQIEKEQFNHFALLYYLKGRLLLNRLDSTAMDYFALFEKKYQGHAFCIDVLMRQAWWKHIYGDKMQRDSLIKQIQLSTFLPTSNDKQAKDEISSLPEIPIELLKARLLFDGAYYQRALEELLTLDSSTLSDYDLADYYYRSGRIYRELDNEHDALYSYKRAILLCEDDDRYIGPYAALEAAKIAAAHGDYEMLSHYLNKASKLNNGQYKTDIQTKIITLSKELEID